MQYGAAHCCAAEADCRRHFDGGSEGLRLPVGHDHQLPGFRFKYGFVQVVANIPHAKGLWPAVWNFLPNLAEYLPGKRGYCSGQFRDQVGRDLEVLINQVLQVLIRPGSSHLGR